MHAKTILHQLRKAAPEIRRRFGVKRLSVFGSVARGEARETSDVDLIVEFEDAPRFGTFMDLKFYLEDVLGVEVDLATPDALRPRLRPTIERESVRVA